MRYLVTVIGLAAALYGGDPSREQTLQKAIDLIESKGDLAGAAPLLQEAARSTDRAVAARALVYLGRSQERQDKERARETYQRIARDFADQKEAAAMARQRLAALSGPVSPGAGVSARQIPVPSSAGQLYSDGRHVFYVDDAAGGLVVAGMDGANQRMIFALSRARRTSIPGYLSVSPDGNQIAFNLSTPERFSACVIGIDGSGFRDLYQKSMRGPQPVGDWSPDGKRFIQHLLEPDGSYTVATISVADGSLQKIFTDPTVRGEFALATGSGGGFSPDGKFIYYAVRPNPGRESNIHVVAVDGSYHGRLVEHPSTNFPIGFAPDGRHFLFQSNRSGKAGIFAVSVANGRPQADPVLIKQEPGISETGTSLTRTGAYFYTVGEQNVHEAFTLALDPATGTVAASPQLLSGPSGLTPESAAWSPDGSRLALLSGKNHQHGGGEVRISVRNAATGKERDWPVPPETEAIVGWAADGESVYTAARYRAPGNGQRIELRAVSAGTGDGKMLASIPDARVLYAVRPSPDGKTLLISYGDQPPMPGRPAGITRLDLATGQQTEVLPKGVVSEATLSPDASRIAALDRQENRTEIRIKPLQGSDWTTIATLPGTRFMYLHWLPSGDLMFGEEGAPNSTLYRIRATGGASVKVGELPGLQHVHEIRVHPSGRQMVFQSYVNHAELWTLENFLPKEFLRR